MKPDNLRKRKVPIPAMKNRQMRTHYRTLSKAGYFLYRKGYEII